MPIINTGELAAEIFAKQAERKVLPSTLEVLSMTKLDLMRIMPP